MTNHPAMLATQETPGAALLGREWVSMDSATGASSLRFFAKPDFANRHGTVHGGFLAAMLDSAAVMTLLFGLPADRMAVTKRLDTRFLKPATLGPISASAKVTTQDERKAFVEAELTDCTGTLVASATAELRIIPKT